MSNKYFYKTAILMSSSEVNPFIEEQIEEYNGLTDLEGKPFRQDKKKEISNTQEVSNLQDDVSLFPINTIDGDTITEQNYSRWLKREIKDYVDALVENYEWKHGVSRDNKEHLVNYVLGKGWSEFVNKLNPIKQFLSNGKGNYKKYISKYQDISGKTLKREYRNIANRLINKRIKNDSLF